MGNRIVLRIASVVFASWTFFAVCDAAEAPSSHTLQASARLYPAGNSVQNLPQAISTLDSVAEFDLHSGVVIRIWRYATKYGEGGCDQGGEVGLDGRTCPRFGLMISTRWEMEDNSKFALWITDSRRWWRLSSEAKRDDGRFEESEGVGSLVLYACEASTSVDSGKADPSKDDNWHAVPYRLSIGPYDKVRLERLPDTAPQKNCWNDDTPPVLKAGG